MVGTATSVIQSVSGFALVRKIVSTKSSRGFPRAPMLLMIVVTIQIGMYGPLVYGFPAGLQLLIVNVIGLSLWLVTAAAQLAFSPTRREAAVLAAQLCATLAWATLLPCGLFFFAPEAVPFETRRVVLAAMMNVANVAGFASPIAKLREAWRDGDTTKTPGLLVIANVLNCSIWCAYGAMLGDVWIYAPNGLGLCLSIAQAAVLGVLSRQTKLTEQRDELTAAAPA